MVDTTDVQGYQTKFENQQALLEDAEIDEADRDAIERFVVHLRASDPDVDSLGTVVGHLNRCRLSAERAHIPITQMTDIEDVDAFKLHLEDVHGLSEGSIRNYMKSMRKFLQWYHDEPWTEAVKVGSPPERKHDPDEEITSDDLNAMLDAASEFDSAARDKALIALLRDTGLRIGAILSFQIQHVDFEGRRGTISINEDANVKDADGPKPVTWSRGYVANWLDVHPRPDDPEAALIHKTRQWGDDEDGALRQQYAGRRIQEIAETAGLDPDRIHAHLFRGTAISEWIRDEMSDQTIKHRADWSEDSRMFGVYSRVTDEQFNDVVFNHYDIGDPEDDEKSTGPDLDDCPQCRTSLRGEELFCPGCAAPLTQAAEDASEDVSGTVREFMVDERDGSKRGAAAAAAEAAENDADFAAILFEELQDLN
ncbi:tyrosine-type recombinase/integrase [Halorussus halobius]|uniref:tyrosine-type recombinase/integrase n=1 Tax=Halorussus halobius TaxID=1710537 RepID=UPI0010930E44|nr:tyrosine-type recombinase/integrase [Halorussus halobius]